MNSEIDPITRRLQRSALTMWRSGLDTVDISKELRIKESDAVNLLDAERVAQKRQIEAEKLARFAFGRR